MSRRMKDYSFWDSARKNNATFIQYYDRLVELAISMFEWKNLPDSVDPRFLELTLFSTGQCLFFKDEVMGYLTLPNAMGGPLNVYRIPVTRCAYAVTGYNKPLTDKDSVIIWNNYLHTNSMLVIQNFAQRLWELDRIIDVNAKAQKTPILLLCNENERLSLKNFYMKYDGGEPMIAADKAFNTDSIKALNTEAPYVADKLYTLKTEYWNEALTYLGISNINTQKKERLISDEVNRNLGGTIASRYSRLEARREAADQINKMFDLEIEVDYREDYREQDDEYMLSGDSEGNEIVKIHQDLRSRDPAGAGGK